MNSDTAIIAVATLIIGVGLNELIHRFFIKNSGSKDPAYWHEEIRAIVEQVMDRRNPTIRQIVVETIEEEFKRKGL